MLVIYGLGNNESKYLDTKHNVGRVLLEKLASEFEAGGFTKNQNYAQTKIKIGGQDVYFIYSLGYMNESGVPLVNFFKYYKLDPNQTKIIVLQDDSDQEVGKFKLMPGGGSGGHKGISSIYEHSLDVRLSTKDIWRLKIGIRPLENRLRSEHFVLHKMSSQEIEVIDSIKNSILANQKLLIESKFEALQNILNTNTNLDI